MLAIAAAAALLLPLKSQAQLGGLTKIAGGAGGNLTAESLNTDLFSGLQFFAKANMKFAEAIMPATNSVAIRAKLEAVLETKDTAAAQAADKETRKQLQAEIEKLQKEHKVLSEDQKALIKEGEGEATKGVAKWGVVAASLAMAAKSGKTDAQLATAIPAAQQMIQDLPDIKNMLSTVAKLRKMK